MTTGTQLSIAENIKKYRLLNNMTQKELAEKIFLDTQYYAQLERGERNFTIEKIALICAVFHIGIEDIIEIKSTSSNARESEELVTQISKKLKTLSYSQLQFTQKFLDEFIPFIK